jgi:hypothetical protein
MASLAGKGSQGLSSKPTARTTLRNSTGTYFYKMLDVSLATKEARGRLHSYTFRLLQHTLNPECDANLLIQSNKVCARAGKFNNDNR